MTIDAISDMATIIRNAIAIKNSLVTLPYTKNNEIIAKILAKEGFIHCVTTTNKINFSAPLSTNYNKNSGARSKAPLELTDKGAFDTKNEKVNSIDNNNLSVDTSIQNNHTHFTTHQENSTQNQKKIGSASSDQSQGRASNQNVGHLDTKKQIHLQNSLGHKTTMNQKVIILALKYVGREKKPMIHAIKRVSKPSLRWYSQSPIPQSLGGLGIFIVSTSFGIITDKEAREKKLGGEILLEIW